MKKSLKYIERVAEFDVYGYENIGIPEAITACKIQELETLTGLESQDSGIKLRIEELLKELRKIKEVNE